MKEQDKQLLLTDLCARLPYGVKVNATTPKGKKTGTIVTTTTKFIHSHQDSKIFGEFYADDNDECFWLDFGLFKPYLRPMSSMTEEEEKELSMIVNGYGTVITNYNRKEFFLWLYNGDKDLPFPILTAFLNWLNEHHFDYNYLIDMGLALEAPEGMYKTE